MGDQDIIVSYSEVFRWLTCHRQYYYNFILGLAPVDVNGPMDTGTKGHRLLQDFYEAKRAGMDKEKALEHITAKANKIMSEEGITDAHLLLAWVLVRNYIMGTEFTAEAILIENRFLLPVANLVDDPELSNVVIGFTPDVVLERSGRFLDVEDFKFVEKAWSKSKLDRFPQTKLYEIFLKAMGYNVSRTLIRFFNVKTGKIIEHPYVTTEEERETLLHDFLEGVREIVRYKQQKLPFKYTPRTMNYTACTYCSYVFPCTLEAQGKDATKTLESQYVKRTYDYGR